MLAVFFFAAALFSAADVRNVQIRDSSFGFMRTPQTITADATVVAPDPRIAPLINAISAPVMRVPKKSNLRVSLKGHTEADLVNAYLHEFFTDSADFVEVRLHLRSGRVVSVVSGSQLPYMLPWVVYGIGDPFTTYNADITRAVVPLLSKDAPSLQLLGPKGFDISFEWPDQDADATKFYRADGLGGLCLSDYVQHHPGTKMHIHIDGSLSLPLDVQNAFLKDEYTAHRTDLLDAVAGQLQLYSWVTLTDGRSRTDWVVGPNNMPTILWRHTGETILGVGKSQFCDAISK